MSNATRISSACMAALVCLAAASQEAAIAKPAPQISVARGAEEGKPILVATVTLNGKPLEDAQVSFSVKRTFGALPIGQDKTLDDGTAAVKFPTGLPGDSNGQLQLVAEVKPTEQYGGARIEALVDGGRIIPPVADPFPRAFWAPHAPLAIVITICTLLAIVWLTYAFVLSQLLKIRKESIDASKIHA